MNNPRQLRVACYFVIVFIVSFDWSIKPCILSWNQMQSRRLLLCFPHNLLIDYFVFYSSSNHMTYSKHNCSSAYKKNVQVPVCPLCNKPVPVTRGVSPDVVVGSHIDNDCKSDRATQDRNKVINSQISLSIPTLIVLAQSYTVMGSICRLGIQQ